MKIVQITGNYPPRVCGVGSYTYLLSEHLAKLGADVTVITGAYNHTEQVLDGSGVKVLPIMTDWQLDDWNTIRHHLDQIKPDVVNLQYQIATFNEGGLVFRLPAAYPVVTTFHDYAGPQALGKPGKALSVWLLAASRRFVVTHDKPRKTFEKFGILRRKLVQIPVGTNIPRVLHPPAVNGHLNGGSDPVLTYFGFVWRGKNIENLLRLQRTLLDRHLPTRLLIVGDITQQDYYAELQQLAAELQVADRVHFTGVQDDASISALLAKSDICILPYSKGATTGHGTLMAAIEHHLPVVTTFDPAIDLSYLKDRHNIMLSPLADQDSLTQNVAELLESVTLRNTIRQNVQTLAQQFSWETIAQMHMRMYQEVSA